MKGLPFLLLFILPFLSVLWAADDLSLDRNQFSIGPEWYRVERIKEGGTKQSGNLFGVRIGYDRLIRWGWCTLVGTQFARKEA